MAESQLHAHVAGRAQLAELLEAADADARAGRVPAVRFVALQPSAQTCEQIIRTFQMSTPLTHPQLARLLARAHQVAQIYRGRELVALAALARPVLPERLQAISRSSSSSTGSTSSTSTGTSTGTGSPLHPPVYCVRQHGADIWEGTDVVELVFWAAAPAPLLLLHPRSVPGLLPPHAAVLVPWWSRAPLVPQWPGLVPRVAVHVHPDRAIIRELRHVLAYQQPGAAHAQLAAAPYVPVLQTAMVDTCLHFWPPLL